MNNYIIIARIDGYENQASIVQAESHDDAIMQIVNQLSDHCEAGIPIHVEFVINCQKHTPELINWLGQYGTYESLGDQS
ncbi:hypothetical protein [Endozoicomonas atrinae]|uniref:hypothetical protein n=1 Tax=Endozoicomonas atrinae TaxID=1333660 RepID=UPI003AFF92B3